MRILITGASSGIGKVLYDYYKFKCHEVIGISKEGPDEQIDISHRSFLSQIRELGFFDVVISNAGILQLEEEDTLLLRTTNFDPSYFLLKDIGQGKILNPEGSFIITASLSGVVGEAYLPYYAAMKAALINLTKSYAKLYASLPIRVNAVSPGFFDTNLVEGNTPPELIDEVPLKREGNPYELVSIFDALIKCTYITGQNIIVDGGLGL